MNNEFICIPQELEIGDTVTLNDNLELIYDIRIIQELRTGAIHIEFMLAGKNEWYKENQLKITKKTNKSSHEHRVDITRFWR